MVKVDLGGNDTLCTVKPIILVVACLVPVLLIQKYVNQLRPNKIISWEFCV